MEASTSAQLPTSFNASTARPTGLQQHRQPVEVALQTGAYVVVMLFSLIGNSLVIVVVKKNIGGQMKSVGNYLLLSMASADLILTVGNMPERVTRSLTGDQWLIDGLMGIILCKATNFFEKLSITVSILNLTLVSVDRFLVVFYPHSKIFTNRKCFVAIGVVWLCSALYCSPVVYYGGLLHSPEQESTTSCEVRRFFPNWKSWYLCFLSLLPLTLLVTVILYGSICFRLWRRQPPGEPPISKRNQRSGRSNRKVVRMVAVILIAFYMCFLPYWVGWVFCAYFSFNSICNDTYIFISIFLTYTNSAMNPVIYVALSENYKQAFKRVFLQYFKCCRQSSVVPGINARVRQAVAVAGITLTNHPEVMPATVVEMHDVT